MGPNIQPQHPRVGPGVGLFTMQCQPMPGTPFVPAPAPSAGLRDPWCTLTIDLPAAQRGWVCCYTPSGTLHPCRPQAVPVESARPAEPSASGQHTALAASSWSTRSPPCAATIQLVFRPATMGSPPLYGRLWADALANLQLAPAVPVATLATAVQTLQDVYAREGRQLSAFEAALPAVLAALVEGLPAGTLAHLNWDLPRVTDANGYVPASTQEALLENYLGSGPATALTAAPEESLRTSPESPLPAQVTPPSPRALSPCSPHCSDSSSSGSDDSTSSTSSSGSSNSSGSSSSSSSSGAVAGNAASPAPASPGDAQAPGTQSPAPPPARSAAGLQGRQLSAALASLDAVDATAVLRQPCQLFCSPPASVKNPLRQAVHFALTQLLSAASEPASIDAQRAWKLLLFRPSAAPRVPKPELRARFGCFFRGQWPALLDDSIAAAGVPARRAVTRSEGEARADRAVHLAHLGELSAARQALLALRWPQLTKPPFKHCRTPPADRLSRMFPWIRTSSLSVRMCHSHFPARSSSLTSGDPAARRPQVRLHC